MSEQVFVGSLAPHPMLERIVMLPDLARREEFQAKDAGKDRAKHSEKAEELNLEWQAFVADVVERGVREPLKIVPITADERPADMPGRITHWVVDGRHRLQAAIEGGVGFVPADEVPSDSITDIILSAVTRRHFSKGALAYLAILTRPATATARKAGRPNNSALDAELPVAALAKRIGVSARIMEAACELYRALENPKPSVAAEMARIKPEAEAAVFGGAGIARVLGWVRGRETLAESGSSPVSTGRNAPNYQALGRSSLVTMTNVIRSWGTLEEETREELFEGYVDAFRSLPPQTLESLILKLSEPK